jgi:tight adherence protein B
VSVLGVAAGVFVVGGFATAAFSIVNSPDNALGRLFLAHTMRLERHTTFLLSQYTGVEIARVQALATGASVVLLVLTRHPLFAALTFLTSLAPPFVLWRRHARRVLRLERQLDTWLLMLANALKSTSSLGEAIASTALLVPRPFSEEVDLLVKELRLGISLNRALDAMSVRIGSGVVSGAIMMIIVARQTGGNLPTTLENAAAALRESARLEGVLRTKTAEGRGQVLVLALVPFVLCLIISWLDPAWFRPMLDHPYGRVILAGCFIAWTMATAWAHHIAGTDL